MILGNNKRLKVIIILLICIQIFSSSRCNPKQVETAYKVAKGTLQTVLKNDKNVATELEIITTLPKRGYITLTTIDGSYTEKFDLNKIKKALDASKNKKELSLKNWNYWSTLPVGAIVSAREFAKHINQYRKEASFDEETQILTYPAPIEIENKTYRMNYSVDLTQHFEKLKSIDTTEITKIKLKTSDNSVKPLERYFTRPEPTTVIPPTDTTVVVLPPRTSAKSQMQQALDTVLTRYSKVSRRGSSSDPCECIEVQDSSGSWLKVALYKNGKLWKVNKNPWNGASVYDYDIIDSNLDGKPDL
ncbi:MAG TPA: hypothetical protein PKC76_10000 [Saprospiraceae bacterium]|nr:hypothetical protein [Saprospiraceae bacterium]HMP24454.1 hypothetical protein [Saprospiraceae bacterium]